jgi:hypothetical protein
VLTRLNQVMHGWAYVGGIELRRIAAIPVTRYRYRGSQIPDPWTAGPA